MSPETGYLHELATLDHPLVGPVVPAVLRQLLADLYVSMPYGKLPAGSTNANLEVHNVVIGGGGSDLDLEIRFPSGGPTLIATAALTATVQDWGPWRVYRWQTTGNDVLLKLVVDKNYLLTLAGQTLAGPYALGVHSVDVSPRKVTSFTAKNTYRVDAAGMKLGGSNPTQDYTFGGNVPLVAGYNMLIRANPAGVLSQPDPLHPERAGQAVVPPPEPNLRNVNTLLFEVVPGAGQGRFPNCSGTDGLVVRTVNGQQADENGNLVIATDDGGCYRLERHIVFPEGTPPGVNPRKGTLTPGEMVFTSNCQACVDCLDFSNAYKTLRKVFLRLKNVKDRTDVVTNAYLSLRQLTLPVTEYADRPKVRFQLVRTNEDAYMIHIQFVSGRLRYNRFTATLTLPGGYKIKYLDHNGWERVPGRQGRQRDDLFKPSFGASWQVDRVFPSRTVANWSYALQFKKMNVAAGVHGTDTAVVKLHAVAREELSLGNRDFGVMTRTIDVAY